MIKYKDLKSELEYIAGREIAVVAVSKTRTPDEIRRLIADGCHDFGENRVQELLEKMEALKDENIKWHFIGQLQSNKVKAIAGKVALIHSVDRLSLAEQINKTAAEKGIVQDILIQLSLAGEEQKGGLAPEELDDVFKDVLKMENLRLRGFMTVPPYNPDPEASRMYFVRLKKIFDEYAKKTKNISILSMGMSGDCRVAVTEGATLVRIGTALFE